MRLYSVFGNNVSIIRRAIIINLSFCFLFRFLQFLDSENRWIQAETKKQRLNNEADFYPSQDRKQNLHTAYAESSSSNTSKKAKTVDVPEKVKVVSRNEQ